MAVNTMITATICFQSGFVLDISGSAISQYANFNLITRIELNDRRRLSLSACPDEAAAAKISVSSENSAPILPPRVSATNWR